MAEETEERTPTLERVSALKRPTVRARQIARFVWLFKPVIGAALAFALASAVIFATAILPGDSAPVVRVKGEANLELRLERKGVELPLGRETKLQPGDRLYATADPAGAQYLLVVGIDPAGAMRALLPPRGRTSAHLTEGRQDLPNAITINDNPGPERWFAFFSTRPLQTDTVWVWLSRPPEERSNLPEVESLLVFTLDKQLEPK